MINFNIQDILNEEDHTEHVDIDHSQIESILNEEHSGSESNKSDEESYHSPLTSKKSKMFDENIRFSEVVY